MTVHLVPLKAASSGEGFASDGWGQVHGAVPEEYLLAVECLLAGGARHRVLANLNMVVDQLVFGGKGLGAGAAGEVD